MTTDYRLAYLTINVKNMRRCLCICFLTFISILRDASCVGNAKFDCIAKSEDSLFKFNFSELSEAHLNLDDDQVPSISMRIRLCSPLLDKCNGLDGYSICSKFGNQTKGLGKAPPSLTYNKGHILFNFTGDQCDSKTNYTVLITMRCDYDAKTETQPQLFGSLEGQCTIHMIWNTVKACIPAKSTNCTVSDRFGNEYNLTSLIRTSDNYEIPIHHGQGHLKMILNVCHNVIHQHESLCTANSGVCLQNSTNPDAIKYDNFGDVDSALEIENGVIRLKYRYGNICPSREDGVDTHQTTISFKCATEPVNDEPVYISNDVRTCKHEILWETPAACNETVLRDYSSVTAGRCRVSNPVTKFEYDLQSLMNQDFRARAPDGSQYTFRVCSALVDGRCSKETGACHRQNSTSAGKANTNLMWQYGGAYLNYTGGESCGNNQQRYTIIAFFCGVEGSASGPIIMENEPCYVIIHWNTDLACEKRIKCTTDNDQPDQVNLTPLIQRSKNYIAKASDGTEFHINVCRPLVSTHDVTCAPGSAVCQTIRDANGRYTKEISLGFPDERPQFVASDSSSEQSATLNYHSLTPCPEIPGKNMSSSFKFTCDYDSDKGDPEYEGYSNCVHNFKWKTSRVCGAAVAEWAPPCSISNNLPHPHTVDLSPLGRKSVYNVVSNTAKQYRVSICAGNTFCNGSAICEGLNGYGSKIDVVHDYNHDMIILKYSTGSTCQNKFYESELRLTCNASIGIGEPKLSMESNCTAIFDWETSVACVGNLTRSDEATEQNTSSVQGAVIFFALIIVLVVVLGFVLLRNPQIFTNLRSRVGSLTRRKNHSSFRYSRVNTTEEARLLDSSELYVDCQVDSDDELLGA